MKIFNMTAAFKARNLIKAFIQKEKSDLESVNAEHQIDMPIEKLRWEITTHHNYDDVKRVVSDKIDSIIFATKMLNDLSIAIDNANLVCCSALIHRLDEAKANLALVKEIESSIPSQLVKVEQHYVKDGSGKVDVVTTTISYETPYDAGTIKAFIKKYTKAKLLLEDQLSSANAVTTFSMNDDWTNWYNKNILNDTDGE